MIVPNFNARMFRKRDAISSGVRLRMECGGNVAVLRRHESELYQLTVEPLPYL